MYNGFAVEEYTMYKRKILEDIKKWEQSLSIKRRALVIKGLRQIGKTTTVNEYCKSKYESVIYINFMEMTSLKAIFNKDLIVDDMVRDLSAAIPKAKFIPHKTVLIFDELQECANARSAIKPFMIDGRFDIIATGSLIGLRGYNKKESKGIPTGFEYVLQMYPMDFEEYLWAREVDENVISYVKECYEKQEKVSDMVNASFMQYFKEYLCVGGMPDAVTTFLMTKDLNQVYDVQKGILHDYKDDFGKHLDEQENEYTDSTELTRIMEIYNSIPVQVAKENKKFQYGKVKKNAKGREYRFAITWLEEFGLIKLCYNLNNLELPLEGNKNAECFKVYVADTGLFSTMLGRDTYNDILNGDLGIYKGAIYENIIADAFVKNDMNLYYFNKANSLEIDFIVKLKNALVPIEVKSRNGNAKSLTTLLKSNKYSIESAIKLVDGNVGIANGIYTIPLYMAFLIK